MQVELGSVHERAKKIKKFHDASFKFQKVYVPCKSMLPHPVEKRDLMPLRCFQKR